MSKQTEALKLALEQTLEMLSDNREYIEANERSEYLAMYDKAIAGAEKALAEQPAPVVPVQDQPSNLKRLAAICPELNMSNYNSDDVDELNNWAIEVANAIDALAEQPAPVAPVQQEPVGLPERETEEMHDAVMEVLYQGQGGVSRSKTYLLWEAYRKVLATNPQTQPAPVVTAQDPVATITPLMEQQMFDDWCPYKGNPDPRTVWAAAVDAVNGLLLGAAPQAPAAPVQVPFLVRLYNEGYHAGHHHTVEGYYTHVVPQEMDTYHSDLVAEWLTDNPQAQPAPVVNVQHKSTTYTERFTHAVAVLCGAQPPAELVAEWFEDVTVNGGHRLQSWVGVQHATPSWAQCIVVLDAAHVLANEPEEGEGHEDTPQAQPAQQEPTAKRLDPDDAWNFAKNVWNEMDRKAMPGIYMQLVTEAIVKHYTTPQAQRKPLTDDKYEAIVDDLSDWRRYVEVDTAHQTLEEHVRQVLTAHGIKEKNA